MRRALVLTVLMLSLRVEAGVALRDTVSSCPSIIKNVITTDILLSDDFVPLEVMIDSIDTIVNTVNTDNFVDTINTINTINTNDIINTVNNKINTVDTVDTKKRKIKIGRRVAFNHSQVSNVSVRIYTYDGDGFVYTEYPNKPIFGLGVEAAGIVDFILSDALLLNFSPGLVLRKPINTAVVGTSEVGLSFPLLIEWGPFGGVGLESVGAVSDAFSKSWSDRFDRRRLRLFGGVWVGVPLYAWVKWNGEESVQFKERAAADFGVVCGVGVYVSDKAFVDVRGIFGLSGYDGVEGRRLNQLSIGVNYVK